MISRPVTQVLLALALTASLAAAHAEGSPLASSTDGAPLRPLDLSLHVPLPAWRAAPGITTEAGSAVDLHGTATLPNHDSGDYRLAPHVELLTGYDPEPAFEALDFRPRARLYAVVLKLDF